MYKLCLLFFLIFFSPLSFGEKNFYEILGVSENASQEDIKKARNELAKKYHPDSGTEPNEERMKEVNKAFDVLSDTVARNKYDKFGHSTFTSEGDTSNTQSRARQYGTYQSHAGTSGAGFGSFRYTNHFSYTFRDLFTRDSSTRGQWRLNNPEKAFYLFFLILDRTPAFQQASSSPPHNVRQEQRTALAALKDLLTDAGISQINKDTLRRILRDFHADFNNNEREHLLRILRRWDQIHQAATQHSQRGQGAIETHKGTAVSSPQAERMILEIAIRNFIDEIERRYVAQNITAAQRQAMELFHRFSFLNQSPEDFSRRQERYLELLQKQNQQQLTKAEKVELRDFEREIRADINIFRRILQKLGLPSRTHNEFLLRSYLDGLKENLLKIVSLESRALTPTPNVFLLTDGSKESPYKTSSSGQRATIYIEDKRLIEILKEIKRNFDDTHYRNLRAAANPFSINSIKGYSGMSAVFLAAIGASLFRKASTDSLIYGADRNPEEFWNQMSLIVSPSGLASIGMFLLLNQQLNYRLYGLGRLVDGKRIKTPLGNMPLNGRLTRAMAPGASLGGAYFISSLFMELMHDENIEKCVEQLMSDNETPVVHTGPCVGCVSDGDVYTTSAYMDPCEKAYIQWLGSGKWKFYAVDIALLLGSGWLARKLLDSIVWGIRSTAAGSSILLRIGKLIGLKFSGWIGFFVEIYFFMEINSLFDEHIGRPIKEHFTTVGIKDTLTGLTNSFEEHTQILSRYSDISSHYDHENPDHREELFSIQERLNSIVPSIIEIIKELGYEFQQWVMIRAQFHKQSADSWNRQLNKFFQPYRASSQLLKSMFTFSHLNYGLEVENKERVWDSYGDIKQNATWTSFNRPIDFNLDLFYERKDFLKTNYCLYIDSRLFFVWFEFCENPERFSVYQQDTSILYETAFLIYIYLTLTEFPANTTNTEDTMDTNFLSYLGRDLNEMFSSDPNYSVHRLSLAEKLQLSITLMEQAFYIETLHYFYPYEIANFTEAICSSWFPNHETDEDEALLYEDCLNDENTKAAVQQKLTNKFLAAGIYLLKELLDKMSNYHVNPLFNDDSVSKEANLSFIENWHELLKDHIAPLTDLFRVYKKGEKYFLNAEDYLSDMEKHSESGEVERQKELLSLSDNQYLLIQNLLCETDTDTDEEDDNLFVASQFFPSSEITLYNPYRDQFTGIEHLCNISVESFEFSEQRKVFHSMLFDWPVRIGERSYENLYLALESILRTRYSSSRQLVEDFQSLSQSQMGLIGSRIMDDLEILTNNYYKDMINSDGEIDHKSGLQHFSSYYHEEEILFDIGSFTGGLKGLEIPLFQVNYWMNTLKKVLALGERNGLNHEVFHNWEGFDENAFEQAQLEVLALLQHYHDSYKNDAGPYIRFPDKKIVDECNETFNDDGRYGLLEFYNEKSCFAVLQKTHRDSLQPPIIMDSETILSHILAASVPSWNTPSAIRLFNTEDLTTYQTEWEQLVYSLVFELKRSLNTFFAQLEVLTMRDFFEKNSSGFVEQFEQNEI